MLAIATVLPTQERPEQARFVVEHLQLMRDLAEVDVVELDVRYGPQLRAWSTERDVPGLGHVTVVHATALPMVAHRLAGRAVAGIAEARRSALLHSHSLETGYVTSIAARRSGTPWLHTEHSSEWTDQRSTRAEAAFVAMSKRAVARADSWTAVSEYLAAGMARGGVPGPIAIVPNVVDLDRPMRASAGAPAAGEPVKVLSVGLLNEAKQPLLAVEAFAEFCSARPGSTLTWIGAGPLETAVRQRVRDMGLDSSVRLMQPMRQELYRRQMAAHDLLLLPTRYETFSVVAAEALASGLPVVMGNRGGHTEFVDSEVGVLVPGNAPGDVADGLEQAVALLAHPPAVFRQSVYNFGTEPVAGSLDRVLRRYGA